MLQMSVNMNCDCDCDRERNGEREGSGVRERKRDSQCDRCAGVCSIIWKIKVINEQYTSLLEKLDDFKQS